MKELATHFQIEGSLVYIFRVKASISSEFMLSLDQEVERRCGLDDNLRLLLKPKSFEIASKVHLWTTGQWALQAVSVIRKGFISPYFSHFTG